MGLEKPHAVCIPYPAQGHINPMLKLAKLLHSRGFYITFVYTEFNYKRLLRSRGSNSISCLDDFCFETIPDGLPPSDRDATQDIPALCDSTSKNCLIPFRNLVTKLNNTTGIPQVSCIVADGVMSFTLPVADELCIPEVLFWTTSACGFLGYLYYRQLIERGFTPFKGNNFNCFVSPTSFAYLKYACGSGRAKTPKLLGRPRFICKMDSIHYRQAKTNSDGLLPVELHVMNGFDERYT